MKPSANKKIFGVSSPEEFKLCALSQFRRQMAYNHVYCTFVKSLGIRPDDVSRIEDIPFLPISFYKTHKVISVKGKPKKVFQSSGTTGQGKSWHCVADLSLYRQSFTKGFKIYYGSPKDHCIMALFPNTGEFTSHSSLHFMLRNLIEMSRCSHSGFYHTEDQQLCIAIKEMEKKKQKYILFGLSHALLSFAEKYRVAIRYGIVMETGGMKRRRKEIVREELHQRLCHSFGVAAIHSEYGMTELLSQAYSLGAGIFFPVPWMKVLARDADDPFALLPHGRIGGINIIDLANVHSCSFIATEDLGRTRTNGTFEVIGRMDHSEARGCNVWSSAVV